MEDFRVRLNAGHTVVVHHDHTYQRQPKRTLTELLLWNLKRAEVGEKDQRQEGGIEEDKKQETGEADRQQETEAEQEEAYTALNKTPGLRKEVCRKGEKAMEEEREIETVGEEIPRIHTEREVTEQSATDAQAAQAPIPNEAAHYTREYKEEEQEHQEEVEEKRAACGAETEGAALPNPREDPQHLGGAAAEGPEKEASVVFKKVKKTRRGKRGRKKRRQQTENATDWSEYEEEEEEQGEKEEEEEECGWGTDSLHRRRAEERWCDGMASPPGGNLRQRFYPGRQIHYGHYYYNRGGFYARERWMNEYQEGLRHRWMDEHHEAVYAPRREYVERERRMETGAWMETGTELWNRHWEEVEDTGVGMRLSFWCPRGRERGNRWSYQRVRRQLVNRSSQR